MSIPRGGRSDVGSQEILGYASTPAIREMVRWGCDVLVLSDGGSEYPIADADKRGLRQWEHLD